MLVMYTYIVFADTTLFLGSNTITNEAIITAVF